jgi:hypothetical protein
MQILVLQINLGGTRIGSLIYLTNKSTQHDEINNILSSFQFEPIN